MSARDLLAAATPRPWFVVGLPWNPHAPWINAESEDPHGGSFVCDLDADEPNENAVGDAALIVAAVNEYEALLAIAELAAPFADLARSSEWNPRGLVAALAALDAARSGP